ncbi:RNA-guided endonuclease InsQ/TnpB family protein [Microbispora bryophytorum]|uniref:RNA-guided endonuclease InsQ/TnpB family protein n=1 Tax=Microbispora bryophytorum TaxID=1460882 RepID=UPI003407471F
MRQSFKFLLRPTSKQAASLAACLEDHRQLHNAALEHRRTAYRRAGATVRYGDQSGELKHIRADDPAGQGRWSFSSQQATLRRLDKAFAAFFKRVREGHMPGFSRFKGRGWFDTVEPHRLAVLQRDLARTKRGSRRRRKAVARVAALHAKVRRQRLDGAHKAESAGRELIAVNPANTSRTCARCGHCARDNRLTQAEFACTACGHTAHADMNAAIDILGAELALRDAAEAA